MQTYKLVLIGDKETGKTTYLKRLLTGEFENKYIETLGLEVHPLTFNTNYGMYKFNVWDTAGNEKNGGLRDGYYLQSDCCIVFYTKNSDHLQTDKLVHRFLELNPNAKLVIVWNKCDLQEEKNYVINMVEKYRSYIKRNHDVNIYQISGKSLYNQEKPFVYLLRQLTNKQDLVLV